MYEKGPRQFYDDTCVVPEKFDGMYDTSLFFLCREMKKKEMRDFSLLLIKKAQ